MIRKFIPRMVAVFKNVTNLSVQVISNTDIGRKEVNLDPIIYRGSLVWGDPMWVWGDPYLQWGPGGIIEAQRRFGGNDMRCSFKQIELTNAYVIIARSDGLCTAVVDSVAKTATLSDIATYDWPTDILDYYICFEDDSYDTQFLITGRTADVVTYSDATNLSTSGTLKWYIKGYPKNQKFILYSIGIEFTYLGETQQRYSPLSIGSNA